MPADFYSMTEPCTVKEDENVNNPIYTVDDYAGFDFNGNTLFESCLPLSYFSLNHAS
jgi:hypothetical protein